MRSVDGISLRWSIEEARDGCHDGMVWMDQRPLEKSICRLLAMLRIAKPCTSPKLKPVEALSGTCEMVKQLVALRADMHEQYRAPVTNII